jgi:hypothetical protein
MLAIYVLLFNVILDKGIIPESWTEGIMIPIYKNAIRECKTKILSTVENPLLNPACAPEISSTSSANLFNLLFRTAVNVLLLSNSDVFFFWKKTVLFFRRFQKCIRHSLAIRIVAKTTKIKYTG